MTRNISDDQKERPKATLALADGTVFQGSSIGSEGVAGGEVVFNTSLSGYQEILTDPSYASQILTFTCPHIGNVGVNSEDVESRKIQVSGVIIRQLSEYYSNFRAEKSLEQYLKEQGIVGMAEIDTRSLVLHLRAKGSQMGVVASGDCRKDELIDRAKALKSLEGANLVDGVTTDEVYDWSEGAWELGRGYRRFSEKELSSQPLVVAVDLGVKFNILRLLTEAGFRVKVVPATMSAEDIFAFSPDGIFLSNGPGDPQAVTYAIETVKELVGKKPLFGICLGHQILGLAMGAPTFKLKFGHRGGNHPVRNEASKRVVITVQNHGFAVVRAQVPKAVHVSHLNLNDQTVEGFELNDARAFSIQYHPEASPGPHDARYLFDKFRRLVGEEED